MSLASKIGRRWFTPADITPTLHPLRNLLVTIFGKNSPSGFDQTTKALLLFEQQKSARLYVQYVQFCLYGQYVQFF